MYMRIGDEKILVTHCRFGKGFVEVNKRFCITDESIYDSEEIEEHTEVKINGVVYNCTTQFEDIRQLLEEM